MRERNRPKSVRADDTYKYVAAVKTQHTVFRAKLQELLGDTSAHVCDVATAHFQRPGGRVDIFEVDHTLKQIRAATRRGRALGPPGKGAQGRLFCLRGQCQKTSA